MINPPVADFIEENMANEIFSYLSLDDTSSRNAEQLFSAKVFPQKSKPGVLTLKQKDSIFIITEGRSFLWGDVSLPKMDGVKVLTSEDMKFRYFISKFLIEDYDMHSKILLIWQSKADKSETFTLSQGSFVRLCGNVNWRINVPCVKQVAPLLKSLEVSRSDFYEACRLAQAIAFAPDIKIHDQLEKKQKKLFEKNSGLEALAMENLLPLYESPEMNIIGWYLD